MKRVALSTWAPARAWWLVLPSALANVLVAAAAGLYLQFAAPDVPEETLWVSACFAATVWLVLLDAPLMRRLKMLRALSAGAVSNTPEARIQAIAEVRAFAIAARRMVPVGWAGGTLTLMAMFEAVDHLSMAIAIRLLIAAVLFAPIAWVLVSVLTTRRMLVAVETLSEGLSSEQLETPAVSATDRTRFRVVIFTVIMVTMPTLMLADVARTSTNVIAALALEPHSAQAIDHARVHMVLVLSGLGAVALMLVLLAAWVAATGVAAPLRRVADEATALSHGVLGAPTVIAADAEVGIVTGIFTRVKQKLVDVIRQLHRAGAEIDLATGSLRATARRYETGSVEQASALAQIFSTTEGLARSARQISQNASNVQNLATKTLDAADEGRTRAEAFQSSVDRMKQDNQSIASALDRLQQRVVRIGAIIDFIKGVADRSELLALSAELEGTRAGEVGRGFSLVAAEMRRLAENVLESTEEVGDLIGEIRDATAHTSAATVASASFINGSTLLAAEVRRSLSTVAGLARETSNAVRSISLATQQQETGTDQLAEAMADILSLTQQGLATTQQLTVANEQLRALSMNLSQVVERFT